jgi:hypothetical protein
MDRAELNALIGMAVDALDCERCHGEFFERVAYAVVENASNHNVTTLANRVRAGELSAVEAFDMLAYSLRPLYRAIGQELEDSEVAALRRRAERRANARHN